MLKDLQNTWGYPETVRPEIKKLSGPDWIAAGSQWTLRKHSWVFFIFEGLTVV